MGDGELRGDVRGLRAAGDRARDSRGTSMGGDSIGAGEPGDRGGEGVPTGNFLPASSPGTFTVNVCFVVEDLEEPYCIQVSVKVGDILKDG